MTKKKENYFVLNSYDEELKMCVQFHYWTSGKYYYSSTELEDGTTERKKRISEKEYINALEILHNA